MTLTTHRTNTDELSSRISEQMREPPAVIKYVYNPDPDEGHHAHMASLRLLIEIILANDAEYGVPEKVDSQDVA